VAVYSIPPKIDRQDIISGGKGLRTYWVGAEGVNRGVTICNFNEPEENPTKYPDSSEPAQGLIIVKFKGLPVENRLKERWEESVKINTSPF